MRESSEISPTSLGKQKSARMVNINPAEIGAAPLEPKGNSWILSLINRSNTCFVLIRTKNVNSPNWGKWWRMGSICQTCTLGDSHQCFEQKKWQQMMVTDCASVAFELEIATEPDAQGQALVASWDPLHPNCSFAGGVVAYE